MSLIALFLILIALGIGVALGLRLLDAYLPLPLNLKAILMVAAILLVVLWLVQLFGLRIGHS